MHAFRFEDALPQGYLAEIDIHFARLMTRLAGGSTEEVFLASALLSRAGRQGHVCLALGAVAGGFAAHDAPGAPLVPTPSLEPWVHALGRTEVVGRPGDYAPMVLDGRHRLYLYRYWDYEKRLAREILARAAHPMDKIDMKRLGDGLSRLFPEPAPRETDWQKLAAFVAVTRRFSVISGGPGTGKSSLISKVLSLVIDQARGRPVRIALAAPTGKAAARMQEAVRDGKARIEIPEGIREAIDPTASTIHRLLGTRMGSPDFRHDKDDPLEADVVILDEASMVDLALMAKLIEAVPPSSRLILLGDRDQLASVEAGAVLGEICNAGATCGYSQDLRLAYREATGEEILASPHDTPVETPIRDCVVQLRKSYRFTEQSGIGAASRAVNQAEASRALAILKGRAYEDASWQDLPAPEYLQAEIRKRVVGAYGPYLATTDPLEAIEAFSRFRILCALRKGPYGVIRINRIVEGILAEARLIRPNALWYPGRPILVTENDYTLGLFNGDIGIVLPDQSAGSGLSAWFFSPSGDLRRLPAARLPEHETVFAMTVHKSQGTEFDRTLFLLPDQDSPVLTRELLYTGLTRARHGVEVWGKEAVFMGGVQRRAERFSGLRELLWGQP